MLLRPKQKIQTVSPHLYVISFANSLKQTLFRLGLFYNRFNL